MKKLRLEILVTLRGLLGAPIFFLVAMASIAVAVALGAAVGQVAYQEFFGPLPYADGNRLVAVWEFNRQAGAERESTSTPNLVDWRNLSTQFDDLAATTAARVRVLDWPEASEPIPLAGVTPGYFQLLGAKPAAGALFTEAQHTAGVTDALISEASALRQFGSPPSAIGRRFELDGRSIRVVGVLPVGFRVPQWHSSLEPEVWIPLPLDGRPEDRRYDWLSVIGRLKTGTTIARAAAEMTLLSKRLGEEHPDYNAGYEAEVVPLREALTGDRRGALAYITTGLVIFLALVLINLTTLAQSRFQDRLREQAVRLALGAGRLALMRFWILESLVIALIGSTLGLLSASWGLSILRAFQETLGFRFAELSLSLPTALISFTICTVSAALFGTLLGLRGLRTSPSAILAVTSFRAGGEGSNWRRMRQFGLGLQVALALTLLLVTGLLGRSLWNLHRKPLGFEPTGLATAQVMLPISRSSEDSRSAQFLTSLLTRWRSSPGIESVGAVSAMPLATGDRVLEFDEAGKPRQGETWRAAVGVATPGFFTTARVRLLAGRLFRSGEQHDVALINQKLADEYFPGGAVGHAIRMENDSDTTHRRIVGVVENVHQAGPAVAAVAQVYLPHHQRALSNMTLVARTNHPEAAIIALRDAVRHVGDRQQHVLAVHTGEELRHSSMTGRHLALLLAAACGVGGLILAMVGIFGLVAYSVACRRREIAIRMALGAAPRGVLSLVLRQTLTATALGAVAGTVLALAVGKLISSLLFGVSTRDPLTFALIGIAFLATAMVAAWLPARRALLTPTLEL